MRQYCTPDKSAFWFAMRWEKPVVSLAWPMNTLLADHEVFLWINWLEWSVVTPRNLVPRAIREPDKWTWCRLQNVQDSCTFFRLVSWEGSTWASWDFSQYGGWYSFLHSLCFSTVYAFRSHLSGERCSWCPRSNYGNSFRRFAASVNCFQGPCCSRTKRFRVTFSMLLAVFPFLLLKTFRHQPSFRRTLFRCFQLFARLTAILVLACLSIHKAGERSHEHYRRIVCVSWSDDHFVCVQVGFLGMSRQQHNGIDQSQTMFYWRDCANHSAR